MPTDPGVTPAANARLEDRIARLEQLLEEQQRELQIQFDRISQIQADIDIIRGAWARMTPSAEPRDPSRPRGTAPRSARDDATGGAG